MAFGSRVTPLPPSIDGKSLLWALSLNESEGGEDCGPRHEPAYDVGGDYADVELLEQFGSAAACSYGPLQIMLPNASEGAKPSDFDDLDTAMEYSVDFLNKELQRFKPLTLTTIGQIWNHGSPTSAMSPGVTAYVNDLTRNYDAPMPKEAA